VTTEKCDQCGEYYEETWLCVKCSKWFCYLCGSSNRVDLCAKCELLKKKFVPEDEEEEEKVKPHETL